MARRYQHKPPAHAAPAATRPSYGHVSRDGEVHRVYRGLEPVERQGVIEAIGLKWCQRVGHRHRVPALRDLHDLGDGWRAVDDWLAGTPDSRAVGDLFDPLVTGLVERARELLGDHADEPTAEHLAAMCTALASERSVAQARLLLATVIELEFTAAPEAERVAATDPRFSLPVDGTVTD